MERGGLFGKKKTVFPFIWEDKVKNSQLCKGKENLTLTQTFLKNNYLKMESSQSRDETK
jgi:hypothetical protein